MTRYTVGRAEVNRAQIAKKFEAAKDLIDDAIKETAIGAVEWVVPLSPVDTGTYMLNHAVGENNNLEDNGYDKSSEGKDRKQDWQPVAEEITGKLSGQILDWPSGVGRFSIGNLSFHADEVEYTHGYAVYTSLRSAWPSIKADAVARAEAKYKP